MQFRDKIRQLREEKGLTQKQIADLAGLATVTIQNYELGKREPSFKAIQKLSQVFGVDLTDLANYVDEHERKCLEIVDPVPDLREKELLSNYHQLNDEGQDYLVMHSRFLLTEERYKKEKLASS